MNEISNQDLRNFTQGVIEICNKQDVERNELKKTDEFANMLKKQEKNKAEEWRLMHENAIKLFSTNKEVSK